MLYAFIDESYIAGDVHIIGALVLTSRQIDRINNALDDVIWKSNHANPEVPLNIELHGQNLFQRDAEWACLRPKPAVAFAIYRSALARIATVEGKWFVGGVRRLDRLALRYSNPWPPHQIALQYALEMVAKYADDEGETVRVIADQVPDQAHHEARIQQFRLSGTTPGWRPRDLSCIEMPFDWADSRSHRALQAADMLTYVYLRKRFAGSAHKRTVAEVQKLRDIAFPLLAGQHVWTP